MTTANNIEQGGTIRKRFSPTPVYTPGKKVCHEIKDAETPHVKAIEKDSTHAPSLIRKKEACSANHQVCREQQKNGESGRRRRMV